jgi:hypothetical protein
VGGGGSARVFTSASPVRMLALVAPCLGIDLRWCRCWRFAEAAETKPCSQRCAGRVFKVCWSCLQAPTHRGTRARNATAGAAPCLIPGAIPQPRQGLAEGRLSRSSRQGLRVSASVQLQSPTSTLKLAFASPELFEILHISYAPS